MSRLPGKRARPVLRGPRRGNAPGLPDWKGVYYLLESEGFDCWLVNAHQVKGVPGRRKSDAIDAAWLAQIGECELVSPSFAPRRRSGGCAT